MRVVTSTMFVALLLFMCAMELSVDACPEGYSPRGSLATLVNGKRTMDVTGRCHRYDKSAHACLEKESTISCEDTIDDCAPTRPVNICYIEEAIRKCRPPTPEDEFVVSSLRDFAK